MLRQLEGDVRLFMYGQHHKAGAGIMTLECDALDAIRLRKGIGALGHT